MGWETRGNYSYYYTKEREGGQVRSRYHSGLGVNLAINLGRLAALEREETREKVTADRAEDKKAVEACRKLRAAVCELMRAAGFHEHKRQWRRRRMAKRLQADNGNSREEAEYLELMTQAIMSDDPSEEARAIVAGWLSEPGAWRQDGDLMRNALEGAVKNASQFGHLGHETLRHGVEEMRAELLFEQSTLPERLLIEQVLLCWVRLGVLERSMTAMMQGGSQYAYLNYLQMAMTLAQRRYTNAIQSLARVRRLMQPRAPRVQVNAVVVAGEGARQPEAITIPAEPVKRLGER